MFRIPFIYSGASGEIFQNCSFVLRIEKDKNKSLCSEIKCMTFSEVQVARKEMEFMEMTERTASQSVFRAILLTKASTRCCRASLYATLPYTQP